jgi:hypothetical protein
MCFLTTTEEQAFPMDIHDPNIINLHEELAYMFTVSLGVLTYKLQKVWHSKPPWVWDSVKVIQIQLLIGPCTILWRKPKFPQRPSYLLPHPIVHSPVLEPIGAYVLSVKCRGSWEQNIRHRTVSYSLVKGLLEVEIAPWLPWLTFASSP